MVYRYSSMNLTWAFLAVASFLVLHGVQYVHIPSIFSPSQHDHLVKRSNSPISVVIQQKVVDPGQYPWQDHVELLQFEHAPIIAGHSMQDDYEKMTIESILLSADMFLEAIKVITAERKRGPKDAENKSLRRYSSTEFSTEYRNDKMYRMFERWLQMFAISPWNNENTREQCLSERGKPRFYYNDPPAGVRHPHVTSDCSKPNLYAYHFASSIGFSGDGIVLCPLFFETFRKFEDVEASKYLLGPYFEFGYKSTIGEPTFFSAKILLHELLHYRAFYDNIVATPFPGYNLRIVDILIVDPSDTTRYAWTAYGAFMAQKAATGWDWVTWKDPINKEHRTIPRENRNPLWNVDNWVYFIVEHYVKFKLDLSKDWEDSPDRRTGPYFPPNHPLGPPPPPAPDLFNPADNLDNDFDG